MRQRSCTGRSWEVHSAIRTFHLRVSLLHFFFVFSICVDFSVFFVVETSWQRTLV